MQYILLIVYIIVSTPMIALSGMGFATFNPILIKIYGLIASGAIIYNFMLPLILYYCQKRHKIFIWHLFLPWVVLILANLLVNIFKEVFN